MKVTALAPAKINLALDVTGKREDGYHSLQTVFQAVSWYDRITVERLRESTDIRFTCSDKTLETAKNTAYRAAELFCHAVGFCGGVAIGVEKCIPQQAGLAGGSADAAGVLAALNELTGKPLSVGALQELGGKIGADVPFCLMGGTALGTGTGTELTPLPPVPFHVVLVKPEGGVSTPEAYTRLDSALSLFHPDVAGMCAALRAGDSAGVFARVGNSFEAPLALPETAVLCRMLVKNGASAACLSGSGSAVFGLFRTTQTARQCAELLQKNYPQTKLCEPCGGIIITKEE